MSYKLLGQEFVPFLNNSLPLCSYDTVTISISESLVNAYFFQIVLFHILIDSQSIYKGNYATNCPPVVINTIANINNTGTEEEEDEDGESITNISPLTLTISSKLQSQVFLIFPSDFNEVISVIMKSTFAFSEDTIFYVILMDDTIEQIILDGLSGMDEDFPGFHAPLVIARFEEESFAKWSVLCYLCDSSDRLNWIPTSKAVISSRIKVLEIHQSLNWKGHGKVAFVQSKEMLEFPDKYIGSTLRSSSCEFYLQNDPNCTDQIAIWHILKTRMNFSIKSVDDYFEIFNDQQISLKACLLCDLEERLYKTGSHLFHDADAQFRLTYCNFAADFETSGWQFFIEPFDPYIWIGITVVIVAFSMINRDIGYGVDIIYGLIYQPFQKKWTPIHSIILLVLPILSFEYECFMTTIMTAPPEPYVINKVKEAFDAGYLYVINDKANLPFAMNIAKEPAKRLGLNLTEKLFVVEPAIDQFNGVRSASWFQKLAEVKGLVGRHEDNIRKKKDGARGGKVNVTCHIIEELFDMWHRNVVMRSFMSKNLLKHLHYIKEAYIDRFWYHWFFTRKLNVMKRELGLECDGNECSQVEPLGLKSSIFTAIISFYAFAASTILIMCVEILIKWKDAVQHFESN